MLLIAIFFFFCTLQLSFWSYFHFKIIIFCPESENAILTKLELQNFNKNHDKIIFYFYLRMMI